MPLPEPQPATDGQREPTAQEIANQLIAAVNAAIPAPPSSVQVDTPPSGNPPPTPQPGSPPMTARETQVGRVALYVGCGVSMPILAGAVFMVATERANPDVIAWCAGGIGSLAALVAALGYLVKRIVTAAPPPPAEVHYHVEGSVEHKEINVENVNKWGGKSSTTAVN